MRARRGPDPRWRTRQPSLGDLANVRFGPGGSMPGGSSWWGGRPRRRAEPGADPERVARLARAGEMNGEDDGEAGGVRAQQSATGNGVTRTASQRRNGEPDEARHTPRVGSCLPKAVRVPDEPARQLLRTPPHRCDAESGAYSHFSQLSAAILNSENIGAVRRRAASSAARVTSQVTRRARLRPHPPRHRRRSAAVAGTRGVFLRGLERRAVGEELRQREDAVGIAEEIGGAGASAVQLRVQWSVLSPVFMTVKTTVFPRVFGLTCDAVWRGRPVQPKASRAGARRAPR